MPRDNPRIDAVLSCLCLGPSRTRTDASDGWRVLRIDERNDGDRLITIDLTTGAGTLVGDIVGVPAMSGLAINSAGDICSGHGRLP